jgi:Ca-activated chloride channel family protein
MSIYTLLVLSLTQPFSYKNRASNHKKGRDLVIIMDTSGSMANRGFSKENLELSKYDVCVAIAKDFIKKRFNDNIGLVVFGSFAFSASPLTYDLKALGEMFDLMSSIGIAGDSTAIGDALIQGIETLKSGNAKSKVLILLTDGKHNIGNFSPKEGVELAKKKGIKIYTIGIGKRGDYDKKLLTKIAKETNAKSFFASNSSELKEVYNSINKLEPSPIPSGGYIDKEKLFWYPLFIATILFLILLLRQEREI